MQSYGSNAAIKEVESVMQSLFIELSKSKRKMLDEFTASRRWADVIRNVEMFLVTRLMSESVMPYNIDKLADILRRFGSPTSYAELAAVTFGNYRTCKISSQENGVIVVDLALYPSERDILTQSDKNIATDLGDTLSAAFKATTQMQNDYVYLVNYLAPNHRKVIVNFSGA